MSVGLATALWLSGASKFSIAEGALMTSAVLTVLYLVKTRHDKKSLQPGYRVTSGAATLAEKLPAAASLDKAAYRIVAFAFPLYTVAIICGSIWAEAAWGRYWGWDPKETWAFITLLVYIVAVHGRIAGWWGQFGMAVASVVCFAAVVMASYGVNYVLGKGLHSYGRGVGGEGYVAGFLMLDALFLAVACWRHAQAQRQAAGGLLAAIGQERGETTSAGREEVMS